MIHRIVRGPVVLGLLGLVTGCSNALLPGSSQSLCPVPGGAACASVETVYEAARSGRRLETPPTSPKGGASPVTEAGSTDAPARTATALPPPGVVSIGTIYADSEGFVPAGVMPLRHRPPVMRIWMAPFTTADGDLVMAGYVFTEVEPRRWTVGAPPPRGAATGIYTVPPELTDPPLAPRPMPETVPMAPPSREFQDVSGRGGRAT